MDRRYTIGLPRNYQFISRLPLDFKIQVIKTINSTKDGIWYFCRVQGHELNILSQVKLKEGRSYTIHKKDNITLELVDKKGESEIDEEPDRNVDYLG